MRDMFARISPRYDLLNHLLSINIDKRWRRRVVEKLKPWVSHESRILDVACGTGVVASALIFSAVKNVEGPIDVLVRGGNELQVGFEKAGSEFKNVTLTGPADFVFEGTIDI